MDGRHFNLYLASLEFRTTSQENPLVLQTFIVSGNAEDNDVQRLTTADLRLKRILNEVSGTYRYTTKWHLHTSLNPPTVLARMHIGTTRGPKWAGLLHFIAAPNHVEHVQQATAREGRDEWDAVRWVNIILLRLARTNLVQTEGELDIARVVPAMEDFMDEVEGGKYPPGDDGCPPTIGCPLLPFKNTDQPESQNIAEFSDFSQSL